MHLLALLGEATTAAEVHARLLALADAAATRAHSKATALSPRSTTRAVALAWLLYSVCCGTACALLLWSATFSLPCSVTSSGDFRSYGACFVDTEDGEGRPSAREFGCRLPPLCVSVCVYTSILVTPDGFLSRRPGS